VGDICKWVNDYTRVSIIDDESQKKRVVDVCNEAVAGAGHRQRFLDLRAFDPEVVHSIESAMFAFSSLFSATSAGS
jgi:hypothetical protein